MYSTTTLGEISDDIRYGMTASAQPEGTHRFIRITDITDLGQLKAVGAKYVDPNDKELIKYGIQEGDLLIARSGSVGRPFLVPAGVDGVFASYLIRFRINKELALPEYVFYALSPSYREYVGATGRGAAIKNINAKQLAALDIPLPPIDEQRRIVARIKECVERVDEIEELRADAMGEHEHLLESQVEALLAGVEGDTASLADVCSITSKLIDPRESQYQELRHVGGANIESKTGMLVDLKTAAEEGLKSGKFVFDDSMVLYNKIRPYLVKVARPEFSGLCSADMYPLTPDPERLTRDYLFYALMSRQFTQYAIAGSNRAGMPKVNRKHLFAYELKLPSADSQVAITQILDLAKSATDELRTDMAEGHAEMGALRQSILNKAFAGEL